MHRYATVAAAAAMLALAGCASPPSTATSADTQAYTSSFTAPAGSARVYILPTQSKGMFSDADGRARLSIFPDDAERGASLGSTAAGVFIAFDIAPGSYDLVARGGDAFSKVFHAFDFVAGKTYFLRPTFFRSAKDLGQSKGSGMTFDVVPADQAEAELRGMAMAKIPAKGVAFLRASYAVARGPMMMRMMTPTPVPAAAVPVATPTPAVTAAPAPVAAPAPAPSPAAATLESKLETLRRLRKEGLITQSEYDAKRKALLDAF